MKQVSSPTVWPGVFVGALWLAVFSGAFVWLFQLYGFGLYSIGLLIGCHFCFAIGAGFNSRCRERFAQQHGLSVSYQANVFGKGRFFAGYRDARGQFACDAAELIDRNEKGAAGGP